MDANKAALSLDESGACVTCGSYACECYYETPSFNAPVETACRAFYDDARGLGAWERLTASDPALASDYRLSMRRALKAVAEQSEPSDAQVKAASEAFAHRDGALANREDMIAALKAAAEGWEEGPRTHNPRASLSGGA